MTFLNPVLRTSAALATPRTNPASSISSRRIPVISQRASTCNSQEPRAARRAWPSRRSCSGTATQQPSCYCETGESTTYFPPPIYRAAGRQNLRNRREHSVEYIRSKLVILDFVLAHLDYRYFETEAEKVEYFCSKLGLNRGILPAKRYSGAIRHKTTGRYFVDKFPLFLVPESSSPPVITFSFVDPGLMTLCSFETHLLAYGTLFSALPLLNFVYIATRSSHFESARKLFFSIMQKFPNIDPGEQVLRYFTLRKLWEAKLYGKLNDDDLEFLNRATKQFNDALTDIRYHQWLQGRTSSGMIRAEFRDLAPKQEVSFRTEFVDGQTALFQPSVARRVSRTGVTKVTQPLQGTFGAAFAPAFGVEERQAQEK